MLEYNTAVFAVFGNKGTVVIVFPLYTPHIVAGGGKFNRSNIAPVILPDDPTTKLCPTFKPLGIVSCHSPPPFTVVVKIVFGDVPNCNEPLPAGLNVKLDEPVLIPFVP